MTIISFAPFAAHKAFGLGRGFVHLLPVRPGPGPSTPWRALPASTACLAATLRLFARLVPKQSVPLVAGDACEELCRRDVGALGAASPEALMEAWLDFALFSR